MAEDVGKVYLVGAGPGDPGLITVKGADCLRTADVVLYDAIANPLLLAMYAPHAEHIDASKRKGHCAMAQQETIQTLIELARAGRTVVRLKGGDPCIFGRGGEEARALFQAGVPFEIVPGVSSVSAVPAYAGIPITDRDFASSFGVYSLHKRGGLGLSDAEWRAIAQGPDTLVLLMGQTVMDEISAKLIEFGRPATMPAALVTQGTTTRQRRVVATLANLAAEASGLPKDGPGLIVVGDVVRAIPLMDWFVPAESEEPALSTPHERTGE